jgi:NADPH-dependent glutamate synthase beta subunit-like oxidoreductase
VTLYEATAKLGGLLRSAIAAERLPEAILDWDIAGILAMGVTAETDQVMGKDFTLASLLQQGFEAVFLAAGGWDSRLARGAVGDVEAPIPGVYLMVDFLRFAAEPTGKMSVQSEVAIFGGGKLALRAAKFSRRLGAAKITVLLRETWEDSPVTDAEVENLAIEGLTIVYSAGISRLQGEAQGLTELEYVDTKTQSKTTLPVQTLILAAGRFPELIFGELKPAESEGGVTSEHSLRWQAIPPYKQPAFREEVGLFAQGDVLADYTAAIKAIGAGRRAAASIQQIMSGIEPSLTEHVISPKSILQDVDHVENVAVSQRQIMPICSGRELAACGEIERGFSAETAQIEASRCLQCGLICYEQSQETLPNKESVAVTAPLPAR